MLNNITNFFNLIKTGKVKTQLDGTDLLPIGTRDNRFTGQYQPTMIKYSDLVAGLVGGSNGQVLFNDNDTIAGASNLYWDKLNERVGIGTSTPSTTFAIGSGGINRVNLGLQAFEMYTPSSVRTVFLGYSSTSGQLIIASGGSNDVNFLGGGFKSISTGNFAIGTTTDAGYKLDVNGTVRFRAQNALSTDTTFRIRNTVDNDSLLDIRNNGVATVKGSAQVISFNLTDRVYIGLNVNNNVIGVNNDNKLFIRSNGNLNIITVANSTVIVTDSVSPSLTPSSKLTVESTTQGFLPPRQTQAQRTAIASPAVGLIVYQTDGTEGLYIYKSTGWALNS